MRFVILNSSHTIASAIRTALEKGAINDEFVACYKLHPLDEFIEIEAPTEKHVRLALLNVKEQLNDIKKKL